ncbi:MAG: anaerobic sulfatase maturase [Phycisphaerae bacterium]
MNEYDFQIMVKPVCGRCNLSCGYCYYARKPQELYPEHSNLMMKDDVLENFVRQYMAAKPQRADFCWQGGEPLLAGKDFFQKVVGFQKQFGSPGQIVGNALQTNGTLLDDQWCEFFDEYKFFLGLSLDGPAQFHDAYRKNGNEVGSFDQAWRGVNLLVKHRIEFNVLTTLHAANSHHGADLYRFFINRGIRYLQFIPILERNPDGSAKDFSCPSGAFGRFMLDVFEVWVKNGVGVVSERFIDSVLTTLVIGQAGVCWNQPRCPKAFVLEWNGDLYACDHFVTNQWRLGNIMQQPLTDLAQSPLFEEFVQAKTQLPSRCRDCEFVSFCQGGCPKHHQNRRNYFCEDYRLFFKHALPQLKKISQLNGLYKHD